MSATTGRRYAGASDVLRRLDGAWLDVALAAVFGALFVAIWVQPALVSPEPDPTMRSIDAWWLLGGLVAAAAMVIRRTRPLLSLVIGLVAVEVLVFAPYDVDPIPAALLVSSYSVARHATGRRAWAGLALIVAGLSVVLWSRDDSYTASAFAFNLVVFTSAWIIGREVRLWRQRLADELDVATERLRIEQQRSELAVTSERLRIAQELHDVVAHSMSVIAVQAGMGEAAFDRRPEEARRALAAIASTSRSSLNEMRRMLGVLRDHEGDPVRYAPAPGLDGLDDLVGTLAGAGLTVEVTVDGMVGDLPGGVDLSAYRIVQEALTNVLKHAGPARAQVSIHHEPGVVTVEVVDDGRGAAAHPRAAAAVPRVVGHGHVGMRERVAVYGGTLDVGPAPGGGYRVRAHLPYGTDAARGVWATANGAAGGTT